MYPASRTVKEGLSRCFLGHGSKPWVPSTSAGGLRELLSVPLRSQGYCGDGPPPTHRHPAHATHIRVCTHTHILAQSWLEGVTNSFFLMRAFLFPKTEQAMVQAGNLKCTHHQGDAAGHMARTLPEEKQAQPQLVLLQGNGAPGRQGLQSRAECLRAKPCTAPQACPAASLTALCAKDGDRSGCLHG